MMNYFCQVSTVWQVVLLVLSLLTVISLAGGCTLLFRHRYNARKKIAIGVVLLLFNSVLYVLMQIDSRITGAEHSLHLPYVLAFLVILLSLAFSVWFFLNETKNRKTINNTSIKEAFDNLPTGVCFFNEVGLPVLCNRTMQRFSFAVCGKDAIARGVKAGDLVKLVCTAAGGSGGGIDRGCRRGLRWREGKGE
jgi:hypothetical protein